MGAYDAHVQAERSTKRSIEAEPSIIDDAHAEAYDAYVQAERSSKRSTEAALRSSLSDRRSDPSRPNLRSSMMHTRRLSDRRNDHISSPHLRSSMTRGSCGHWRLRSRRSRRRLPRTLKRVFF